MMCWTRRSRLRTPSVVYGVVIDMSASAVDAERTNALRKAMRAGRRRSCRKMGMIGLRRHWGGLRPGQP